MFLDSVNSHLTLQPYSNCYNLVYISVYVFNFSLTFPQKVELGRQSKHAISFFESIDRDIISNDKFN